MPKTILVLGATGQQGGATVNALVDANADVEILAVTRNPDSAGSKKLAQKSDKIKFVKGDLNHTKERYAAAKKVTSNPIWGVFSVQVSLHAHLN